MANLILRELSEKDEPAFLAGYEDWKNDDLTWYSFVWKPGMSHTEHLRILEDLKDKSKIASNRVPSTMLYGFVDGEVVGRFNIRHELNPYLRQRGGNVGYSVAARHRNNGYGTEMFLQGIRFCQCLGLEKILITCSDQNGPSWKIIEKFGGSLESRFFDEIKNEFVRCYWLTANEIDHPKYETKDKAIAYITRTMGDQAQLLVFDHDKEHSDAGTQVPAGTVNSNENIQEALLREVQEETGLDNLKVLGKIDEYTFFRDSQNCFNRRHVFHLTSTIPLPDKWTHLVTGNDVDQNLNFHYSWLDVVKAKGDLSGRLGDSVDIFVHKTSREKE
jgi:predicted acetyltransferase/8-oxo-dGTP pyrophosphatase MutT (NUDIX family)